MAKLRMQAVPETNFKAVFFETHITNSSFHDAISPQPSRPLRVWHPLATSIALGIAYYSIAFATPTYDENTVYYPRHLFKRNDGIPTAEQVAQYLGTYLNKDHSVFYCGERGDDAEQFAEQNDYYCWHDVAESVSEHFHISENILNNVDLNEQLQSHIPRGFAMAVKGKVCLFSPDTILRNPTFWTPDEWPALQVNPAVTEIVLVKSTGAICTETTIFVPGQAPTEWLIVARQAETAGQKRASIPKAKVASGAKRPSNMCRLRRLGRLGRRLPYRLSPKVQHRNLHLRRAGSPQKATLPIKSKAAPLKPSSKLDEATQGA
ncbi:hypothetical protein MMC30_000712 [Trapelia coarctata]|nr:hypothetical protein [Trapelia coarctata]